MKLKQNQEFTPQCCSLSARNSHMFAIIYSNNLWVIFPINRSSVAPWLFIELSIQLRETLDPIKHILVNPRINKFFRDIKKMQRNINCDPWTWCGLFHVSMIFWANNINICFFCCSSVSMLKEKRCKSKSFTCILFYFIFNWKEIIYFLLTKSRCRCEFNSKGCCC